MQVGLRLYELIYAPGGAGLRVLGAPERRRAGELLAELEGYDWAAAAPGVLAVVAVVRVARELLAGAGGEAAPPRFDT